MKNLLLTLTAAVLMTASASAQVIWVNRTDLWSQSETLFDDNDLMFSMRDGTIANGSYNINCTRRLFLQYVVGATTTEPQWHPDVAQIISPSVFQNYPIVGTGYYTNNVFWGLHYVHRNTSQTFEKYVDGVPSGVMATRSAEERVNQYVWINAN